MFVSFILPVYNVEKYIEKCMDSLLVQTGCQYEILLIDDGSTDHSGVICDRYQTEYPDTVRVVHKENEGLLLTRRRGFKEAKGDWFICVDSDDYVASDLLQTVVYTIDQYHCDMVMYNYYYTDDQGNTWKSKLSIPDHTVFEGIKKQELYKRRLLSTEINMMCMRAIRRDIVDIDQDYSDCGLRNMCEDAFQVLPLYTNSRRTVFVDAPLYYYRKNGSSITGQATLGSWKSINRSFVLEQKYLDLWHFSAKGKARYYTKHIEDIVNCLRWLYGNGAEVKSKDLTNVIKQLKDEALFDACLDYYDKRYLTTKYNRICVPLILLMLKNNELELMRLYFKLENKVHR